MPNAPKFQAEGSRAEADFGEGVRATSSLWYVGVWSIVRLGTVPPATTIREFSCIVYDHNIEFISNVICYQKVT